MIASDLSLASNAPAASTAAEETSSNVLARAVQLAWRALLLGLVAAQGEAGPITAIAIYVASMIAMFSCSATYNLVSWPAAKEWLPSSIAASASP